jgi:hypothetical protein
MSTIPAFESLVAEVFKTVSQMGTEAQRLEDYIFARLFKQL